MQRGGFRCPGCGQQLRIDTRYAMPTLAASILLAALVSYVAGFRGLAVFFATTFLWIPVYIVGAVVTSHFGPRLVKHTPKYGDADFRLTGPPDSPNKRQPPSAGMSTS